MSISKLRGKSALGRHESTTSTTKTTKGTTAATTTATTNTTQHGGANIKATNSSSPKTTATTTTATAKVFNTCTTNAVGASAGSTTTTTTTQQTYLPQTSLLKIEPFVPSFNTRLRRPIGRSYSTLSSTYLKRTSGGGGGGFGTHGAEGKQTGVVGAGIDGAVLPKAVRPVGHLRKHPVRVVARQRSKSTSSSAASNRPATAAANGNQTPTSSGIAASTTVTSANNGAIVIPQPNGICRISRLPREQEKLPDRINYDRRGLTAIPIFEHESNLRLLSLQHNLINIFHIPKEDEEAATTVMADSESSPPQAKMLDDANQNGISLSSSGLANGSHLRRQFNVSHGHSRTNAGSGSRLSQLMAAPAPSPPQSNVGFVNGTLSPTPPPFTAHPLTVANQLLKRNGLLQKQLNYNGPQLPTTPQPQLHTQQQQLLQQQQQPQYRFAMKKSQSFVSNYSRHLHHMRRNLHKSFLTKTEANMIVAHNLKSFDSSGASGMTTTTTDSMSTLANTEMEEDEQQLEIKNKQLRASYGTIFQNLVFLDLYDNQIERIANLDGLPTLSVLLLGKNRISDISGLASLRDTLRVLDLHGNKITSISNRINCLQELKSLNLAGNQIRQINQNDFNGLLNLKELNLKRNKIKRINGFQHLTALERLWLCHNDLHKVEDMSSIAKAINLLEVTIENNPVSLAGDCVSFLVSYLPHLQSLSQMPITDQVRRAAMAWRKNKELSDANYSHLSSDVFNSIRREEVISNARTNWELLRSQQTVQTTLRNQRSPNQRQRELAKINESNEAVVGYEELQEFIKLPPIQQPQQHQEQTLPDGKTNDNSARLSGSSGSSLGPNVDSSSSSYSSDNEESPKLSDKLKEKQRVHVKKCQKPISMRGRAIAAKEKSSSNKLDNGSNKQPDTKDTKTSNKDATANGGADVARDAITITTTPPPQTEAYTHTSADTSTATAAEPTAQQLTVMNSSQADNNSSMQGISNASITMLSQTERPTTLTNSEQRTNNTSSTTATGIATATISAQTRVTTPTTPITGSNSTLSLGFHANNTMAGQQQQTSVATTTIAAAAAATTAPATCKRNLMRSQTIGGGHGVGSSGRTKTNAGLHATAAGLNNGHHVANGSNIVSIVAPVSTATAANSKITQLSSSSISTLSAAATAAAAATLSAASIKAIAAAEREREQGGDYLIEICGRYLNIYGQGALRFIDKQWNPTKANDVHTLNFSYINFNNISAVLARIKVRFPHAENFVFRETNIVSLGQLNALAELQGIASLFIDPEGNAITTKDAWRQYAIYRLSHWGLKLLNGVEVSEQAVDEANDMYAGMSDLVLWSMPEVMLQPLLARLRLDETCTASKMSPKEWLMKDDNKSLRLVVGKEALQWKKSNASNNAGGQQNHHNHHSYYACDVGAGGGGGIGIGGASTSTAAAAATANAALSTRERGKIHFALMMENTCNAVEKLHKLETLWPSLLLDIVRNTLLDYSQLDVYLRNLMSKITK